MLKRILATFGVLSLVALIGTAGMVGCDDSSPAKSGTGGAIGGGTGGVSGTGGESTGTGGAAPGSGGAGGASTGTGGSTQATAAGHMMIINAAADPGVTVLDPSITGTPPTYNPGTITCAP